MKHGTLRAWAVAGALWAAAAWAQKETTNQPFISHIFPPGGQRGTKLDANVCGSNLQSATALRVVPAGVTAKLVKVVNQGLVNVTFDIAPEAELGTYEVRLLNPTGSTNHFRFQVGQLPEVIEKEPNTNRPDAQAIAALPVTINGTLSETDRDYYRFAAKAGQEMVCRADARSIVPFIADAVPGWIDVCLTLFDLKGKQIASVDDVRLDPDPVLVVKIPADGEYLLEVKDILYRGRADLVYRLSLGEIPQILSVYPLGGRRGTVAKVTLAGANLGRKTLPFALPFDAPNVHQISTVVNKLQTNTVPFAVGDLPDVEEDEPNNVQEDAQRVTPPIAINGRIANPRDVDWFTFKVAAGQKLVLEVLARRCRSPLDSVLRVVNASGAKIAEHDDYVDPLFPMLCHHADSRLVQTFPTAGDYSVMIRDGQAKGGEDFTYRLVITPPQPDFALRITPDNPRVARGDSTPITVLAIRGDGYDGEIEVKPKDLPAGFVCSGATILGNQTSAALTLTAATDAPLGAFGPVFTGTGKIGDREVTRTVTAAETSMQAFAYTQYPPCRELACSVTEGGMFNLVWTKATPGVLELAQGSETEFPLKVVRDKNFKNWIGLRLAAPIPNVNLKPVAFPGDKDDGVAVITVAKGAAVGTRWNLIFAGVTKVGKDTLTRCVPAIPIRIIAGKPDEPKPDAPKK